MSSRCNHRGRERSGGSSTRVILRAIAGLAAVAGCNLESSGTGNFAAPELGAVGSTGAPVDPNDGAEGDGGQLSDGSRGTDGDGSGPSDPGSGPDPTTDSGAETGDDSSALPETTSTGGGPVGSTGVAQGGSDSGNTGAGGPDSAHLQDVDYDACGQHLWCWNSFYDAPEAPLWIQQCFESPLTPPYELTQVYMYADFKSSSLVSVNVHVRGREPDGSPGDTFWSGTLTGGGLQEGLNQFGFDVNPVVQSSRFCVGFHIQHDGWDGGLGVGIESATPIADDSWVAGCGLNWTDTTTLGSDGGNWCIAVDIAKP